MAIADDDLYLHGLNLLPQFGPSRLALLARHFGNFQSAFFADPLKLAEAGIDHQSAKKFLEFRPQINLEREASLLAKDNIGIIGWRSENYPKLLREIAKPPAILYYRGRMEDPEELCIAVVGTRQVSTYGKMVTPQLAGPLAEAGAVIVSGMAFGVDSAAHEAALKTGQRTVAVLGGGLDEKSLYPKHHAFLAQRIVDGGGALLSEYPPGTPNFKQNFVARNRIIAGLCVATLIIECDLKSGTLITARYALEQNRQVYAVPGSIYSPQSLGPNNLIKMGARAVTDAEDIFSDLNLAPAVRQQTGSSAVFGDNEQESLLLKLLSREPVIINELIKQSGLDAASVSSALTFLEMKGKIRNLGGQQYVLAG